MKENLGNGATVHGLRFGMLNVIDDGCKTALSIADDAVRHLLRRKTLELPDDADDRNIDFWKDIDRRADDDDGTEDQDQQRHYNEGIRPLQSEANYPHLLILLE